MVIMAAIAGGRVHLRCSICGALLADLNPCRVDEPANPDAQYVLPTPAATDADIHIAEMHRAHPRDACYRTTKRAPEAAEADLGTDPGGSPFAWSRG